MYKTWGKHHSSLSITPAGLSFPSAACRTALHWGCMAQPQHQNNASAPGELIAAGRLQPGPQPAKDRKLYTWKHTWKQNQNHEVFGVLLCIAIKVQPLILAWEEKSIAVFFFFPFQPPILVHTPSEPIFFIFFFQISVHHLKVAIPPLPPQGTFASILLQSLSKKNTPALLPAEGADNMTAFCSLACFPSISQVSLNLITQLTRKRHTY